MNYVIEDNGTIEASYLIAVEKQAESRADIRDLLSAAQLQAEINGFSLTAYDEDGFTGFQAAKTIKVDDLRLADREMLGFSDLPSIIKDYTWHYEPSVFRSDYQMMMEVDLRNLVDEAAIEALPSDLKELAQEAMESSIFTVNITLPGDTRRTNAMETQQYNGKNAVLYSWTLKYGEYKTLIIESTLEKSRTKHRILWGAGAVIGLLALTLFIYLIYRLRKK